jgi:two-component system, NtrC family, nitrogen regulation sensor histidine kinase NtrY
MRSRNFEWRIVLRVALLLLTLSALSFLFVSNNLLYGIFLAPVIIYQVIEFYNFHKKAYEELNQFVESVHYRDFSRNFDVKHAPVELQPLRKGFNEINTTFKTISKEKETQSQYLQKILELVDTGILSYNVTSGDVGWMNESLKKMLQLPYLKTIHSLQKRDTELYDNVIELKPGQTRIATAHLEKGSFKILLSATAFQTEGERYKLIAFQNVNEALDETEAKAWQKLLSVMTHEIMNSIAPISSLADTLKSRLNESMSKLDNNGGSLDDLELGIETIKRRSEGLLKFAKTYRNLNKITTPNLSKVYVSELFEGLTQLMQPTLDQKNIDLQVVLKDPTLSLELDQALIEQVLINLLVNAIDALKDTPTPHITLSGYRDPNNRVHIKIADNGSGMSAEVMENIFIPFFSTKKSGSGIGLSLCKQIMLLHKGNIQVQSQEGVGTSFLLTF